MKVRLHDVHLDPARIGPFAVDVIAPLPDDRRSSRLGASAQVVPAVRGAHDLNEAAELARAILEAPLVSLPDERPTLVRFRELRAGANGGLDAPAAKSIIRELKAVGGNLRAVRRALTGRESGPELWSVIAALPREETLRRIDGAL
jgi:hypothetical protein